MEELLKKIMERAENPETVDLSEAGVRKAAKELGYSDEQIEELFVNFDGFPIDENTLDAVSGGSTVHRASNHFDAAETWAYYKGQVEGDSGTIIIGSVRYKPGDPNMPDLSKFRRK